MNKAREVLSNGIDSRYSILDFPELGDERGNLVVVEGGIQIPFNIQRLFYIYGSDNSVVRGKHANVRSQFVLVNVSGSSKVRVDDGRESRIIELNKPRMGLFLSRMLWKEMYDFSPDSVLLVLSDEHYDGDEYIRDYDEYLRQLDVN